ncbi:hypothetical protein Z951_39935 [Streptomyces sp. PRh5]|uniref:hypothetical protein n=1 Tax=Streptomyces sp. PRh5 TaxID=1158056 RepID=UPI0004527715|nr:hypothetical protein [Streptomyces sp. PRh5]EXU62709.1 hypothetical protein Z951_39935 [Streptomyces sp. PRh5]
MTADALYGQDRHFRRMLEEAGLGHVVAAPKAQQIKAPAGCWRIDQLIRDAPDDAWERLSCGDGAKGPRIYDWAHITLAMPAHAFLPAVQARAQDAKGAAEKIFPPPAQPGRDPQAGQCGVAQGWAPGGFRGPPGVRAVRCQAAPSIGLRVTV